MTVRELAAAVRKYISYRQRLRGGETLSPDDLEDYEDLADLIAAFLARKCGEPPTVTIRCRGRRATVRLPLQLNVTLSGTSDLRECMALNISEGGIFLAAPGTDLQPGTPVNLHLLLQEDGTRLVLQGAVQWLSTGEEDALPTGVGIRFVGMNKGQREALERFLDGQTEALVDFLE